MKNLFLVFSILTATYSQQFHSLDGIESSDGQTILLYRLGSEQHSYNPIFKFNLSTGYEQQIMDAHSIIYQVGSDIKSVTDFEFFPGDTENFMNVGDQIYMDYGSYVARNDAIVFGYYSPFLKVDISKQNPQKVFVFDGGGPVRSWDGGFTFPEDSIPAVTDFIPISLADFDDEVMFGFDEDGKFSKNTLVVDTSFVVFDEYFKMIFDVNRFHIYRVNKDYGGYSLSVSNNKGNAFTWTKTFQSENRIYITIDSTQSGVVYLANGRKIYKSTDNGYLFSLYKSLPYNLIGIYKKPDSNILYAASSRIIYKITPDSVTIVKSIPLSPEIFKYYPLAIGNYWIYKVTEWSYPEYDEDTFSRKVLSLETLGNNKQYFKVEEKYFGSNYTSYVYERIDTAQGLVYRFDNECTNPDSEKVIDDFNAELGDSLLVQRFIFCWDSILTIYSEEGNENILNEYRDFKKFEYHWLDGHIHKLAKGLGIYFIEWGYDFGVTNFYINGCVINGTVYGDTTFVVDVEKDPNPIPTEFKLEQNYPNPFNPSTKISWQSPVGSWQTLKIYDVLGNEVAKLVDEYKNAGSYNVQFTMNNVQLSSGVYFYQLKASYLSTGSGQVYVETKKMLLIK
jgi:hypothetical protein